MKQKKTLKRVLKYIKPYGFFVGLSSLCALLTVAVQLLIPILCGYAVDEMVGAGRVQMETIFRYGVYVGIAALVGAIAQQVMAVSNQHITYSTCRNLRNGVSRKLHRLPLSYLDAHPSGDLVSRMIADVDALADGLLMGFTQLLTGVMTILGILAIMLRLNVAITMVVVLLTPLSFWVAGFIAKRTRRYFVEQATYRGKQTALIGELIEGQSVVRAFGHEKQSLEAFDEVNEKLRHASLLATFFSSLTNPSTRMVNNFVYAGVGLVSGLYAISGGISVGQLSIFLSYASQYAKPFNEISGVATEFQNALYCAERIFELLDTPDQPPETEHPQSPKQEGAVEFSRVSFGYLPGKKVIEELSLQAKPGQKIAIVGPTGCGKTTLINLLMRFYDVNEGAVCLGGTDIRDMTRREVRRRYGMVLQDTWLKAGTVRENIAYGHPEATAEQIQAAAKAAHAHSFIRRLPQGYDTVITENGGNLSAGQRQLLCIARAMLCLPSMLILDEATSSIDTRTEMQIQQAFGQMMEGRTSFVVAHRLSTVREADVILVMEQGRIIEQGRHEELLQKQGAYYRLYQSQFADQAE